MDVKNFFLNGNLSEEVYMQPTFGLFIELNKVVAFGMHFIALNKIHELGLPSSAPPYFALVTLLVHMILPYFFVTTTNALFCFSCM